MKVLFANLFKSYTSDAVLSCLKSLGCKCFEKTYYTPEDLYEDEKIDSLINEDIKNIKPDMVFSINFWPPISRVCHKANVKYVSYGYDSPQNIPQISDMEFETNFIFLFDKEEVAEYKRLGVDRVFHATLATNTSAWNKVTSDEENCYDITLVGSIYESTFPALTSLMDDYLKGFFKAITLAQQKIYGYYMIDELLTDDVLSMANKCLKANGDSGEISKRQLSYSIGSYITHLDRIMLLKMMSAAGKVDLFTFDISDEYKSLLSGININGSVSYERGMPRVFKSSAINLCPILRVIKSGIPQRALDIIGCKAFMLSSYQPEMMDYFDVNDEIVLYDSPEDALEKARFFLKNKDLREQIALAGYKKVKNYFSYDRVLTEMFKVVGV